MSHFSLSTRLTLFFSFIVLLVTITLSAVVFYQFGEKINQQIERNLAGIADHKVDEISNVLLFERTNLLSWRTSSEMMDVVVDDLDKRIATELKNLKHYYQLHGDLYVFNATGALIASTQQDALNVQLPKAWQTQNDYALIFKHEVPFIKGSIVAHITTLTPPHLNMRGYLVMTHSWDDISQLLAPQDAHFALRKANATTAELFTADGVETIEVGNDFAPKSLWTFNHNNYLGAISKPMALGDFSFQIAAFMPQELARKPLFELTQNLLLAAALVGIPMLILVSLLSHHLVTPIKKLTATIRKIEDSNDLSIKVSVSGDDEVADLGNAFNRMTTRLGELFQKLLIVEKELENLNINLERQVIDRTAELALKNEILHLIGQGSKLTFIFDQLAWRIETLHPGILCSIMLLDEDGKHWRQGATSSLPDSYHQTLASLLKGKPLSPPETTAFRGECLIIDDAAQQSFWAPFRELAYQVGMQSCWLQPVINSKGQILGTFAIYHRQAVLPLDDDETNLIDHYTNLVLLAVEHEQAELNLMLAAIAFESQEAMVITDADTVILRINKAFTDATGYTEQEAVGRKINLLKSGRHNADFYKAMWDSSLNVGSWQGEIWDKRKNGEIYPNWLTITAVKDAAGVITHYIGAHIDITKRKAAEDEIKHLAYYDTLTGLPNRRLLQEHLKHAINIERRGSKQLGLLMLDLDRFKAVNDSLGHLAGDELLQQVAARITARLRESDMVARLGGDEFVVLLDNISLPEDAARVAKEIIANLTQPFCLSQSDDVQIGASIGIGLYPQHGDSYETLMDNADAAMYQAKEAGRGCFAYFSDDLTLAARERIALETRLRNAIGQQELRVFFQPQVDIASDRIVGGEALVRWQDPINGLIPPLRFIPIAEETGLIMEIGAWVLRETCRQGRQWLDDGLPPLMLAVNVSPQQFRRGDICALVASVLAETGFPATQLELEITESGLMGNQQNATTILNNLRAQGVRLAIDDFGTGYSSLGHLKHFPLDVLKIDKCFINDIPFHQDDMEIAATIIAMGRTLGFKVLAEGVETPEQLAFLQDKGCDLYQGYLKGKPMPADEFAELIGARYEVGTMRQ
jgi:diguanylate cyclase (GGDEF)-like protein/PAS domain S-box-containing protein